MSAIDGGSEIARAWFERALTMRTGSRLLIECENKTNRQFLIREMNELIRKMRKFDPVNASKIYINGTFKRGKHWVEVYKAAIDQTSAIEVDEKGIARKVSISELLTKRRQAGLMLEDGFSPAEIQAEMGLTEEEMYSFGLWNKDM